MRSLAAALLAALTLGACATTPAGPPPAPRLVVARGQISEQGFGHFTVSIHAEIENPGAAPLAFSAFEYEVSVGEQVVRAGGREPLEAIVAPGEAGALALSVPVEWVFNPEELGALPPLQAVKVSGALVGAGASVPVVVGVELRTPRLPTLSLGTPEAARQRLDAVAVTFMIAVNNDNPFPLTLDRLNYLLEVEGVEIEGGMMGRLRTLAPSSVLTFEVPVELTPTLLPGMVQTMKAKNALSYRFHGSSQVAGARSPFDLSGELTFSASR